MKLVWLTDIHLNFLTERQRRVFYGSIIDEGDAFIVTGDIAEGSNIRDMLLEMQLYLDKPIFFVLGNHDFYRSSIAEIEHQMRATAEHHPHLRYLSMRENPYEFDITENIGLCGVNGWADGQHGDFFRSPVSLNDQYLISEFMQASCEGRASLLLEMRRRAKADADLLSEKLKDLSQRCKKIIVATHVPPFPENALYQGKISSDDFLPFFTAKAIGDTLIETAQNHPDLKIMVLCGHSHHSAEYRPTENMVVYTGDAKYNSPSIAGIIDLVNFEMEWMTRSE